MLRAALKKTCSKRGRKPKEYSPNDFWRVCNCCFLKAHFNPGVFAAVGCFVFCFCFCFFVFVRQFWQKQSIYGKYFFHSRKVKCFETAAVAGFLHDLGYSAKENVRLSSRVCAKCASKIRRAAELKSFLDCSWWRRNVPCKLESIRHRRDSSEEPPWWEFHSYSSIAVISISFVCT